jgi:hypothetical protein
MTGNLSLVLAATNVYQGFRTSRADGVYASIDMGVGFVAPRAGWLGILGAVGYSLNGGSKGLAQEFKQLTNTCGKP